MTCSRELYAYLDTKKTSVSYRDIRSFVDGKLILRARASASFAKAASRIFKTAEIGDEMITTKTNPDADRQLAKFFRTVKKMRPLDERFSDAVLSASGIDDRAKTILTIQQILSDFGVVINIVDGTTGLKLETADLEVEGVKFNVIFAPSKFSHARAFFQHPLIGFPSFVLLNVSAFIEGLVGEIDNLKIFENHLEMLKNGTLNLFADSLLRSRSNERALEIATMILQRFIIFSMMESLSEQDAASSYLRIVNTELSSGAIHEAAHIYFHRTGKKGYDDEKGEVLAHMIGMVYDGTCMSFDLPIDYPPARSIIRELYRRMPGRNEREKLGSYLMLDNTKMAETAKEMLDNECRASFGVTHDQIVDVPKLRSIREHDFLTVEHLPLLEALRHASNTSGRSQI